MAFPSAADVIRALDLAPHPEGGYYRETFRDGDAVTSIYFLLPAGVVSRWHAVEGVEIWHWHAGAALTLSIAPPHQSATPTRLGPDILAGEQPQAVVPSGHWQRAVSAGDWTLVGCTVSPAFTFERFTLAPEGSTPPDI